MILKSINILNFVGSILVVEFKIFYSLPQERQKTALLLVILVILVTTRITFYLFLNSLHGSKFL